MKKSETNPREPTADVGPQTALPVYDRFETQWESILVEIDWCSSWSPAHFRIYGWAMGHLKIRSVDPARRALPITETGFRSQFLAASLVEEAGGPVAFVRQWLDEEGRSCEWHERMLAARQLRLF